MYDVLGGAAGANPPRLKHENNSFNYVKGVPVSTSSPQPPEIKLTISNAAGEVPGYDSNSPTIPFIAEGATVQLTCENAPGLTAQSLSYIIRPHPNNGVFDDENTSAENSYNLQSIVTAASSSPVISTFGLSEWNTSNPGLYGIDVAGVQTSTTTTNYQSDWIYQPLIIAPDDNYILSFNIKDSYFEELNGVSIPPSGVFKQVSLNGHVIWRESITEGGDDWEYVRIDIKNDVDPINGDPIFDHIEEGSAINTITFSIAIVNPANVSTIDLRGLFVWVDDVYLKKFDAPNSLLRDGGFEYSVGSSPATTPNSESDWYFSHDSNLSACNTLDNDPAPGEDAKVDVKFTVDDRKSGSQALKLILDGVHSGLSGPCIDYGFITGIGPVNEVVSASVNFDYRDFVGCADYDDLGYELAFPLPGPIEIDNVVTFDDGAGHNPNLILDRDVLIEDGGTLILEGISLMIQEGGIDPIRITIETGGTLRIRCSATNPANLFACGDMWQGIVNLGGDVFITEPCDDREPAIWDAETAISSTGGKVDLRYVQFNENYIGVELKDGNFVYPIGIPIAIRAVDFNASGGLISKEPHIGQQSHAHIILDNVSDIVIGDAPASNTGTFTNNFSKAEYGIRATNSKATILNNAFTSINPTTNSPQNCTFCGSCIYFENTDNVARDLIIGGPDDGTNAYTQYLKNEFTNSKNGIFTRGNHVTTIQSNTFNNIYQGVRCNRNYENITINEENTFSETKFGVILFNVRGDIVVDGNVFNDPGVGTINPSFYRTAITVQNPVSSNRITNDVLITNNSISNYRIGIHGINSKMSGITGNSITYTVEDPAKLANYHGGIWLQHCHGAFIAENINFKFYFHA
jgi:hypothetical protein